MLYADLYLLKPALIDAEQLIRLQSELSPDEYRHWHEIRQPGRQREYLLGRILLRRLLAERLCCPPDALVFRTGEHGKPTLVSHDWQFNLSHSGDWLVLARCQQGPLGVDFSDKLGYTNSACAVISLESPEAVRRWSQQVELEP